MAQLSWEQKSVRWDEKSALHSKNGPIRDCLADANLDG